MLVWLAYNYKDVRKVTALQMLNKVWKIPCNLKLLVTLFLLGVFHCVYCTLHVPYFSSKCWMGGTMHTSLRFHRNFQMCEINLILHISNNWPRRLCLRHPRWCLQCLAGHCYYQLPVSLSFFFPFFLSPS